MERNSLLEPKLSSMKNPADIFKMSQALNRSVHEYHPLILYYVLSFDEVVHNMNIYYKLASLINDEPVENLSFKDLFLFCRKNKILDGSLSEWMFYQALRKQVSPDMKPETSNEIIKVAPKFLQYINSLVDALEKELKKYRNIN